MVLLFLVVLLGTGGFGLAEHPATSKKVAASASIWKLAYTKWLLRSGAFALHHFDQRASLTQTNHLFVPKACDNQRLHT